MNSDQAIPWKTRADLLSIKHDAGAVGAYTVKDPVKNEFYYFNQLEYFFLNKLRQPQTFPSLIQAAAVELGRKFRAGEIQNYLNLLARDNLIVPRQLGDGDRLYRQRQMEQSGHWKQQLLGFLSIKVPGFHPGGILPFLRPLGLVIFNPVSLAVFLAALLATLLFAVFSFPTLASRAPGFADLLTPEHVTTVLIGFVLAKLLHELGHAVACQFTGHECTEMGVLFLVFMPCLYCDVSDLWTEKKKWKRVLVSLAGVYVELAIAIVCFWVWVLTIPGPLHNFCYSLMLITSINTLFINGNPLMRYDGYYALADLTGVHNLGTVSRQYFVGKIRQLFLRQPPELDTVSHPRFLLAYASCSMIYRWFILFAIAIGIWKFFDLQQLRAFGSAMVVLIAAVAVLPVLMSLNNGVRAIGRFGLRWFNSLVCLALVIVAAYFVLGFEFSHRIWGQAEIQLAEPNYLFAPSDGRFVAAVKDGQIVSADDPIATIENPQLELEHVALASQLREARLNLKFIQLAANSHLLAGQTEHWKKREQTLERQLSENQRQRNDLVIRSRRAGQIVAVHLPDQPPQLDSLESRTASLFDNENQDSQVKRGTPICYVGQTDRLRALIAVDQKDVELIEINQPVKIAVPFRSESISGTVVEIALENQSDHSPASSVAARAENQVAYRVEVELEADLSLRVGSLHDAVILCHKTNTTEFIGRWLRNSFWFQ